MNILNLPEYNVLTVQETDDAYRIEVETVNPPSFCPHCGTVANLYKHTKHNQLIMDLPMHGKQVGIHVIRQRYKCRECNQTFYERLPRMDEKRGCTSRLLEYIEKQSLKRTFVSLAVEIGLDEKTIRNIFRDYVNRLEKTFRFQTPQWLGIDEIHLIKPRCVIANIQNNTIIDILPDRNKSTVINYLQNLPDRQQIKYVAMDMWQPYRDAVKLVLPQAKIVVDKFHVVRMANQALDTVRKSIRDNLSPKERRTLMHDRFILLKRRSDLDVREELILQSWTGFLKDLGLAYELKESFYGIWDSKTKQEALQGLRDWQKQIPGHLEYAFKDLLTALKNWESEIFTYFDRPITNAYTECLNGLIRVMNRLGRGYSFDALRAKILFTEGIHKEKKVNYKKQRFRDAETEVIGKTIMDYYFVCESNPEDINYGADISTLIQLLEEGKL